jgi:hypothetical protein
VDVALSRRGSARWRIDRIGRRVVRSRYRLMSKPGCEFSV